MRRKNYECDNEAFPADAYRVSGYKGIAWSVLGWETEPDENTEWTGQKNRTGQVVCMMIGDDRHFAFDPDKISPLGGDEFCRECGQIGCGCCVYS